MMLPDFTPSVASHRMWVHMGFGDLTDKIEFVCTAIEERRGLERGTYQASLKRLLEQELEALNPGMAVVEDMAYGSFQFCIEHPSYPEGVLLACTRASRLWWAKHKVGASPEARQTSHG
jgi:hypothetical protein